MTRARLLPRFAGLCFSAILSLASCFSPHTVVVVVDGGGSGTGGRDGGVSGSGGNTDDGGAPGTGGGVGPVGTGGSLGSGGVPGAGGRGSGGTSTGAAGSGPGTGGGAGTGGTGTGGTGTGGTGTGGTGTGGTGTGGAGTGGTGTGGRPGTGGTGTGGAGTGGAGTGGAGTGGAGTGGAGTGGAGTGGAGTGGAGTGGMGTGGMGTGGAGTGGSPGGLPPIPDLFPASGIMGSLDGRLMVVPCGEDNAAGTDCGSNVGGYYSTAGSGATATHIQCSGGALNVNQVFYVGGETGRIYDVTVHIYGVSEPKNYGTGVIREAGTGRPAATPTGAGATPTPWATAPGGHQFPVSDYNTSEIRVCRTRACATADESTVYYLNADTQEGHWTYVLNYSKVITVVGGGAVRVRNYDRNCREIKNCGPSGTAANQCGNAANARVVNVSAANPTPANAAAASGGLLQPNLDPARPVGSSGQWLLIDVVSVDSVM